MKTLNKYASCPDWHISPHADCRHRQRWPVCHMGLATARPVCRTWLTTVQCIIDLSLFGLRGANSWAKVHQKGRRPGELRDLPPCKTSSLYAKPHPRYPLPESCRQNDKQTVNDISPACLSACGDNKCRYV